MTSLIHTIRENTRVRFSQHLVGTLVGSDEEAMNHALQLARIAADEGEVPVGAVVVLNGKIIGAGWNQPICSLDPSAHAEMIAIRHAATELGNYRLVGAELYVTLEPCTMCFGVLVHSRIRRLVYGAPEPKAGAVCSAVKLQELPIFNHSFEVQGGLMEHQCSILLTDFFAKRRASKKRLKALSQDKGDSGGPEGP